MTTSFTTISSHLPPHRPAGKPGKPRDTKFQVQHATSSYDHFFAEGSKSNASQRLQRLTRSKTKRGKRSHIAVTARKAHRSHNRNYHRRWYRWCKTNVNSKSQGLDRRRLGNGDLDFSPGFASQSRKDAQNAGYHLYEDHSANRKRSPLLQKIKYGSTMNIASLNACSLLKATMHHQITQYMRRKHIDILCLQETKSKQTTYYMVDSYCFYTFSNAPSDQREHLGTGFVLSPRARAALLRTLPATSRTAGMSFHTGAGEFSILTAHAPHNQHEEDTKHAFYDELNQLLARVETKGPFIIMGDFNARLHGKLHDEAVLGPHLFGKGVSFIGGDQDNRSFFLDFCSHNQLRLCNTWFQHSSSKQVTFKEPGTSRLPRGSAVWDPSQFAQLDFCLCPERWKNTVQDLVSDPFANIHSDHFPILAKVKLSLGANRSVSHKPRWDFQRATETSINNMNHHLGVQLGTRQLTDEPEQRWEELQDMYLTAIESHIPKHVHKPRKEWISPATLKLIAARGEAWNGGDLEAVERLNKTIKKSARQDKKAWLNSQLAEADWDPIRRLKTPFQSRLVRLEPPPALFNISDQASNAEIFATYLEQVQWAPSAKEGVEDLDTSAVVDQAPLVEEGPLTMTELVAAIKHLKTGKAAGKDGIPNEFWKHLSGPGLEALLNLFQCCWSGGASPASWRQAQVVGIFKKGSTGDPANYRPISLLQTCYKLYARILAARLSAGLDPHLRENQYGFRPGRSTSEAIFLIRRLQDLVDAKRNQALFLLFLDWSKAFDTIKPAALHLALQRLKIPSKMCCAIRDLTASPLFEVVVNGDRSAQKRQASGIRQGCTLSPLLFIALQTVMFHDIERAFLGQHPLATTPTVPFFDVEFADDTVLISRNSAHLQFLLHVVQTEAAKYNLRLNLAKCKLVLYNTETDIFFIDGSKVPVASSVVYLGAHIDSKGKPGPEVAKKLSDARQVFKTLMRVWKHIGIREKRKIEIYYSCVVSKLMYGLCTVCLTEKQQRLLDSFHIRCLRSIAGIPSTWGATILGVERLSNEQVRCQLNVINLSDELRIQQLSLLGHILRRPPHHPARVVTYNRFLQPQMLGGPYMRGARRLKWNEVVIQLATTIVNDHYFQGAGVEKYILQKIFEVAQNRKEWSALLQSVRVSWRRPRDATGAPWQ